MTETDEKVLCVGRLSIEAAVVAGDARSQLDWLLSQKHYRWRRSANDDGPPVEEDDRWKQLIPYIVVVNSQGQILAYNRGSKGGEKRLASKWAIGFGGHINDQDESFLLGIVREIREELEVGPVGITGAICENAEWSPLKGPIGFLNDDSDDVGRHHLGVVYVLRADEVLPRENPEFAWQDADQHLVDSNGVPVVYESWARLALPMVRAWLEAN